MQTLDAALGIQHEEGMSTIVTATVFIGFIKEINGENAIKHCMKYCYEPDMCTVFFNILVFTLF